MVRGKLRLANIFEAQNSCFSLLSSEDDAITMKITGTSSYIEVELDGKIVKIEGEILVGGFVAYKDTIIIGSHRMLMN